MPASHQKHHKRQRFNTKPEIIPVKFSRSLFVSRKIRLIIGCFILLALILYPFLRVKKTQADEIFLYPDVCDNNGSEIICHSFSGDLPEGANIISAQIEFEWLEHGEEETIVEPPIEESYDPVVLPPNETTNQSTTETSSDTDDNTDSDTSSETPPAEDPVLEEPETSLLFIKSAYAQEEAPTEVPATLPVTEEAGEADTTTSEESISTPVEEDTSSETLTTLPEAEDVDSNESTSEESASPNDDLTDETIDPITDTVEESNETQLETRPAGTVLFDVLYSFDDIIWLPLGEVSREYLDDVFPIVVTTDNVHSLKISVIPRMTLDSIQDISFKAMKLKVTYEIVNLPTVVLKDDNNIVFGKDNFSSNESANFTITNPDFSFEDIKALVDQGKTKVLEDETGVLGKKINKKEEAPSNPEPSLDPVDATLPPSEPTLLYFFKNLFLSLTSFAKTSDIQATVLDSSGNTTNIIAQIINEQIQITKPQREFRPGRYVLRLRIPTSKAIVISEQDFTWGVLAINVNKSIYEVGDEAYLQMGVLDDSGHTICDAQLDLQITSPSNEITNLTTTDNSIERAEECGPNNVIDVPDYYAHFSIPEEIGTYQLTLTAKTINGVRTVTDSFEVAQNNPFVVERIGPTRIYPAANYPMTLKVTSETDWQGTIIERVPASFEISQPKYSLNYDSVVTDNETKIILWDISLSAGQTSTLGYVFDAPDISPEFYLLGPLKIDDFQEVRQWQIASDLLVASGDGILFYAATSNTTPQWRTYSNSSNNFSSNSGTVAGAQPAMTVIKTSPTKQEAIGAYQDTSGNLRVLCYDGTTWTQDWTIAVAPTGTPTTRRFDIAYETSTGDVTVAYSRNTSATNALAYRTKLGSTSCGSANWDAASNFPTGTTATSGTVMWVKAAHDINSNLSAWVWLDNASTNADLGGAIWSGSAFTNFKSIETSMEHVSAVGDTDNFDVKYSSSSGNVMVVWGNSAGNNGTNGAYYMRCTGGTSSCTWGSAAEIPELYDDATNLDLSANPDTGSDQMVFASIGNAGSDLQSAYWDGNNWVGYSNLDEDCETPGAGYKLVTTGWLNNSITKRYYISYDDDSGTGIAFFKGDPDGGGPPEVQSEYSSTPSLNDIRGRYDTAVNPLDKSKLIMTVSDSTNGIFAYKLTMDSGGGFTWNNMATDSSWGTKPSNPQQGFSFAYWSFIPNFITISGKIYTDEAKITTIGIATTVHLFVNDVDRGTAMTSQITDLYTFSNVMVLTGDVVIVYIDGETDNGSIVTLAADSTTNITNLDLVTNYVSLGHRKTGPITNTDLDKIDGVDAGNEDGITISGGNATFASGFGLLVISSKTYAPGGTVTTPNSSTVANYEGDVYLESSAILSMGTNALSVGGDFKATGSFTKSSGQTTTFTGATTGFSIKPNGNFDSVVFNNSGGGWTAVTNSFILDASLTVSAGIFDTGAVTNTIAGTTSVTGTLKISSTTGTKTFTGNVTVNSGGVWNETAAEDISFAGDLTNNATTWTASTGVHTFSGGSKFISGSTTTVIPSVSIADGASINMTSSESVLTVANLLTVGTNAQLSIQNATVNANTALSGTGLFVNGPSATLNIGGTVTIAYLRPANVDNTINYTGNSQTVICPSTNPYWHLGFSGSGTNTITLPACVTFLYGNLTLSGTADVTTAASLSNISGNLTIGANTTFRIGASLTLTVAGATSVTGTLTFPNTAAEKTFTGSLVINSGGAYANAGNSDLSFAGGIINNSASTISMGTGATSLTAAQSLAGISSISFGGAVTPSSGVIVTNNNTATVTMASLTINDTAKGGANGGMSLTTGSTTTVTGTLTYTANSGVGYDQNIAMNGTANLNAGSVVMNAPTSTGKSLVTCAGDSGIFTVTGTLSMAAGSSGGGSTIDMDSCTLATGGLVTLTGGTLDAAQIVADTGLLDFDTGLTFAGTVANAYLTTTSSATINFTGTMSGAGTLSINAATMFNGIGTVALNTAGTFGDMTISSGTTTTGAAIAIADALVVNDSATLTMGNFSLTVSGTTTLGSGGAGATINTATGATGNRIFTGLVDVNTNSVWNLSGQKPATIFSGGITMDGTTFNNGTGSTSFSASQALSGATAMIFGGVVTIANTYTLTNNNTSTVDFNNNITGDGASANLSTGANSTTKLGGTVMATGLLIPSTSSNIIEYDRSDGGAQTIKTPTTNPYYNLNITTSGVKSLEAATTVTGTTNISAGTLDTVSGSNYAINTNSLTIGGSGTLLGQGATITLTGNWSNSGIFTAATSTVVMNGGTTASVSGTTTFNDFTITHTSAKEVDFQISGSPIFHVTGSFTVTGTVGQAIKLYSETPDTQWKFHPTGTASANYVDVKDGGCESGAISINPTNYTNSGNNGTCWFTPSITLAISDVTTGFGTLSMLSARYATGDTNGSGSETSAHNVDASTNAPSGYILYVQGGTIAETTSSHPITAIGGTPAASDPGTEQFGARITVSGGTATVSSPYNHASNYGYDATASAQSIIGSATAASTDTFVLRYLCNISFITEEGGYSATLTYTAVGNF